MKRLFVTLAGALCFAGLSNSAPAPRADRPETVMVTFHAKAGAEAELAQVIANHWKTAVVLKLVNPAPHLTLRGTDENQKTRLSLSRSGSVHHCARGSPQLSAGPQQS